MKLLRPASINWEQGVAKRRKQLILLKLSNGRGSSSSVMNCLAKRSQYWQENNYVNRRRRTACE